MSSMEDCSEYSNPHHHPQQQSHHRHGLTQQQQQLQQQQQQQQQQHQQQQQQHHHQQQHHQAKLSAALSSNALSHHQAAGPILQSGGSTGSSSTLTRGSRRSSYGPSHYQQQLVPQTVNFHDGLSLGDNISVGSGSIISNHSSQRYMPDLQYGTLSNRIIHHSERYVIDDSSCLQPPSPAPSNDHYVMGMPSPSPSTHHYPERHYTHQAARTMSPSKNRYRHSLTENYRDMSPQCDRYIPPPAHFLNTTNPLAAAESYGYLNSNVHTPVKRYVPTPPPQEPTYQPQTQLMTALLTQTAVNASQHRNNHLTSTLPYRFRVKSCPNEQTISPPQAFDTSDHYATPPRVRPLKCPSSLTASCSASGSTLSSQTINSGRHSRQSTEYLIARAPSADFLDQPSCRVSTPVSVMSEPNGSASCLHCSTLRRATGVHQTTQTSGPISPQPLSISSATESTGRQSPMSPASLSSPMTTAQSSNSLHQSQHNHHQPQSQQLQHHLQQSQVSSNIMTATQSQPQIALESYSNLESRDISTIPRNHAKQQQPSQQTSAHSSEQSIMTSSNSRSILIQYQQQNILPQPQQQPQQQMQPPPAVQSVPPQQMIPQQSPQVQQQPSQAQSLPAPVAPVSLPGPSMQPHSPPVSDSPASTLQRNAQQQILRPTGPNMSRKQRIKEYMKHETAKFFGVDNLNEEYERHKWGDRQKRFAIRRFGQLKDEYDFSYRNNNANHNAVEEHAPPVDRPDVLPAQSQDERDTEQSRRQRSNPHYTYDNGADNFMVKAERKPSVPTVIWSGVSFFIQSITRKRLRKQKQWSRSFAPAHVELTNEDNEHCDGLQPIQDEEAFFDTPIPAAGQQANPGQIVDNSRQLFVSDGDRGLGGATGSGIINGWRTRSSELQLQAREGPNGALGQRISSHILDGVLDNSMRPIGNKIKLLRPDLLDDRYDYRPFFTYWINTVQILVMVVSLICYGFGPIGWGMEDKSAQVLVTSLNLQEVHHRESRNIWIGLGNTDIVHLGAKYGACMRRDSRISDVIAKTRKHERETACCIRNDDSGCVQSSQADCSMRGLWPTKTIATWKKWSPGDSGPGGRISGSVCGLDPKYCDAPASIAPHEWPDDITKWPICRKNNQMSQRFRFKDHTAEHMVCEVIGHPCCVGVYGECRITTREYCDFVSGYFHEEASLCSQISCLNDVCGMFPFIASEYPDQFYRLFTSLCLHAGIIHLAITVAFQHLLMSDLERLIGPLRMAILYIGSGIAGNLTSAIFVPYKAEVGPLPSLAGVLSSLMIQLILCHWKSLKKPHVAMIKLLVIGCTLFGFGTLPWQANFTGLIAGLIFGIGLTLAFVPFVNVVKHTRKNKVNLIWTCVVLQLIVYAVMFIIFYVFPLLFSSLNFIDGNQLTGHGSAHGYHDHYNLYESHPNYNPIGGSGHGHNHGSGGGIINSGNPYVTTYNANNNYKSPTGHNGGISHNHHEYGAGGGGGGGGISMSGGINRISSSNNNKNNNLMKGTMCEKGQCVQRQPRSADTNA